MTKCKRFLGFDVHALVVHTLAVVAVAAVFVHDAVAASLVAVVALVVLTAVFGDAVVVAVVVFQAGVRAENSFRRGLIFSTPKRFQS